MAISSKDEMMLPSEMEIMLAIWLNKSISKKLANSSMDVISEYFLNILNSLARRGYVQGNRVRGYQLTPMGKTTLFKLLRQNEAIYKEVCKDWIVRFEQLRMECITLKNAL